MATNTEVEKIKDVSDKFVGATGTTIYGGYYDEEYLPELRGKRGAEIYDKMRRGDDQVRMILTAIKNPLRSAKYSHEPVSDDEIDQNVAKFLDFVWFENPYLDFPKYLNEVLTYLEFGYCVHEKIFTYYDHPEFGPVHIIGGMGFRKQETIETWDVKGKKGLQGVTQIVTGDTAANTSIIAYIPIDQLCIHTNEQEGDNYEGYSLLRPSYGAWFRKNLYLKLNSIGIEKASIGTIIGKYPRGVEEVERELFISMLSEFAIHEKSYVVCPDAYNVEVIKMPFDSEKIVESIRYEDSQMSKSILFQFLELGQGGGGGSYALAADQSDIALSAMQYIGQYICRKIDAINQMLVLYNFGPNVKVPCSTCSGIDAKAGKELAEVVKTLVDGQVILPDDQLERHVRDIYNLPKAEKTREERQQEQQEKDAETQTIDSETQEEVDKDQKAKGDPSDSVENSVKGKNGKKDEKKTNSFAEVPASDFVGQDLISYREPTIYERVLNLAEISSEFETERQKMHRTMKNRLKLLTEKALADTERLMRQSPENRSAAALRLQINYSGYRKSLLQSMGSIVSTGSKQARRELSTKMTTTEFADSFKKDIEYLPKHVKNGLILQAEQQAKSQAAEIEKIVSFGVMGGEEASLTDRQILDQLEQELETYVEGNKVDSAARTITAQSLNRGRDGFFFDKENLKSIQAFQYSAVLDARTTDICLSLDGQIFMPGDAQSTRLRPPNHHGCRSILIPITINEEKPTITGLDIDPTNPNLVVEYEKRGKPLPDMAKIKSSRNL